MVGQGKTVGKSGVKFSLFNWVQTNKFFLLLLLVAGLTSPLDDYYLDCSGDWTGGWNGHCSDKYVYYCDGGFFEMCVA